MPTCLVFVRRKACKESTVRQPKLLKFSVDVRRRLGFALGQRYCKRDGEKNTLLGVFVRKDYFNIFME
jgi:hypothetical protein